MKGRLLFQVQVTLIITYINVAYVNEFSTKKSVHNSSNIEEKYLCNTCNKEFNRKDNLSRHYENIHKTTKINIICEVCLDQFDTKDDLRARRIAVHENNQ